MEQSWNERNLEYQLLQLIQSMAPAGEVSYIVVKLNEEGGFTPILSHNENMVHASASMIKVLIMATLFHEARLGYKDLTEKIDLWSMPPVMGGGALQELIEPHHFTCLELCRLMMVLSDNWATNLLIQHLGFDAINGYSKSIGMEHTELKRFMMDSEARKEGRENLMTVSDLMKLYEALYIQRHDERIGQEMWNILGRQQFRDKLPFYWGEDTRFYHKTGSLEDVEHDGGLLPLGDEMFGIGVFISKVPNPVGIAMGATMGERIKAFLEDRRGPAHGNRH
ncbi:MAG: serine hydrolase [Veillonella sp.]|uniref:serine hydrolase n=1 Tax=Veillonella sp. TaxID=1926307 RepID=UPI0025FB701B|nr:serine hydrolase [Veillonella sp.]MBS4913542.1 serine hydrolase [Veillonella sp.]